MPWLIERDGQSQSDLGLEVFDASISEGYPLYMSKGAHGRVYALSDDLVVKVWKEFFDYNITAIPYSNPFYRFLRNVLRNGLKKEYDVQRRLYEAGISVPKPEGIFFVDVNEHVYKIGLVMERVHGATWDEVRHKCGDVELVARVEYMIDEEIKRVRSLGIFPKDRNNGNVIYNPMLDKICLIDFTDWELLKTENQNRGI